MIEAARIVDSVPGATAARVIVKTARGAIEYVSAGEGPAVLSVHGGMGGFDQGMLLSRAALARIGDYRVIALSRPGYLGTPLDSGRTPQEQADLFAALLDFLGLSKAFVLAVSAGGPSALQFAVRHDSRCAGVILVSACTGRLKLPSEVAARLPFIKLLARLPWLAALMRWRVQRDPAGTARRSIRDEAVLAATLRHPEAGPLLQALQVSVMERLRDRMPGTLNDMHQFDVMPPLTLSRLQAPVLAIHGTDDRVVPFLHGRRIAQEVPGAELMAIDDGEHACVFTHIDAVRGKVGEFLSR